MRGLFGNRNAVRPAMFQTDVRRSAASANAWTNHFLHYSLHYTLLMGNQEGGTQCYSVANFTLKKETIAVFW